MSNGIQKSNGLVQLGFGEVEQKVDNQKLFGLDDLQQDLFNFCKAFLKANSTTIKYFKFYDLTPSFLLFGSPNTGKTTLCYLLFDKLRKEVTQEINFYTVNVGRILDPALGQSSRNLEQIFQETKAICKNESTVFFGFR